VSKIWAAFPAVTAAAVIGPRDGLAAMLPYEECGPFDGAQHSPLGRLAMSLVVEYAFFRCYDAEHRELSNVLRVFRALLSSFAPDFRVAVLSPGSANCLLFSCMWVTCSKLAPKTANNELMRENTPRSVVASLIVDSCLVHSRSLGLAFPS
jgi:hypothetical protein